MTSGNDSLRQSTIAEPKIRHIRYSYDLLHVMVFRDIKLRYRRSIVGIGWSLINPLAELIILGFVFGTLLPINIPHYTAFLFTGLLAWNWFAGALDGATVIIANNPPLVKLPGFPIALLPIATLTTHFIHFLIALPILLLFLFLDDLDLTTAILTSPLIMGIQFIFTLSLGYFLAALQVNFRDTQYLLSIALKLGFFVTGIFFDPATIDKEYEWFFRLNPMTVLITAYRKVFIEGMLPEPLPLTILAIVSMILLFFGLSFFNRAGETFAEEL